MSSRQATGGYDPSGIDLDAWTVLEAELEATIPALRPCQHVDDLWSGPPLAGRRGRSC